MAPATPLVIAHRGDSFSAPENTGSAFDAALKEGVDGIELDLQLSADGVPVAFHDRNLSKIGYGKKQIGDLTLKELKKLDLGGWFHPRFQGEKILTLDEILRRYGNRIRLFIELKVREGKSGAHRHRKLLDDTLSMISEKKLEKKAHILSFNKAILETGHRLSPRIQYVLNAGFLPRLFGPLRENFFEPFYAICVDVKVLTRPFVNTLHGLGKKVMVYTCNTAQTVERALRAGVDAVISDRPAWVADYLKTRGK